MLAPATLINAAGGQNGFLTACLLVGGILLLDRRPVLAGILFGLLTYKPHLGLVVPFVLLALGAWRTIAAATATAILLIAASVALFGLDAWRAYFQVTAALQVRVLEQFSDFGPMMVTSVMVGVARTFGVSLQTGLAAQIAVAVPVIALAVWAIRQTSDPARRAFVLVTATLLATPYAMVYDFCALTAVMAVAALPAAAARCRPHRHYPGRLADAGRRDVSQHVRPGPRSPRADRGVRDRGRDAARAVASAGRRLGACRALGSSAAPSR